MTGRVIGSAVVALLLALAGCSRPTASRSGESAAAVPGTGASAGGSASATASAGAAPASPDDLLGKPAPDFTATAQDGTTVHIAALKGKPVVVYFYPKDETPGCTKEACSFRDGWKSLAATGAALVGVSADDLESHRAFVAHYHLPFLLVSDPDGTLGAKYGVPFHGVHARQTFIIGADGVVKKIYRHVDVTTHADQVLSDLKT
ncbi:MAG: peroxiredoxin [Polyangiaceae bacterium]